METINVNDIFKSIEVIIIFIIIIALLIRASLS